MLFRVVSEQVNDRPCPAFPKPTYIAREANRPRQKIGPENLKGLNFDLRPKCIPPNFLKSDLRIINRHHSIFASPEKLLTLNRACTWYIDNTFKIIRKSFTQLLTINAFVRSGDCAKQVPLVFALMSERTMNDYEQVNILLDK